MRWMWFFWLGLIHALMGAPGDAIPWFERSIAVNPRYWVLLACLSGAYSSLGDTAKAAQVRRQYDAVYRGEELDVRHYSQQPAFQRLFEERVANGIRQAGIPLPSIKT